MYNVVNEWLALGMVVWSTEHLGEELSQHLKVWGSTKSLDKVVRMVSMNRASECDRGHGYRGGESGSQGQRREGVWSLSDNSQSI